MTLHKVSCSNSALPGLCVFDILSNRHFPRHAHDQYGVGVMLDGGHVSWSGRGQVEAGPNQVITVSPNEIHDGKSLRGTPRRWRMLFVDPHIIAEFAGAEMAAREFPLPVIANLDLARRTAAALHELPNSNIEEASEIIVDLFAALLVSPGNMQRPSVLSRSVQRMVECIHDNFAKPPSLVDLARIADLTPFTAIRRFRRELGTTPHAYLMQYRVRLAYKAICEGSTLADAALVTGFSDQSHMTRAFARQFGMTPGQWRSSQISSRTIP